MFINLQFWWSEAQSRSRCAKNQSFSEAVFLLEALGENPFPCLSQLLEASFIPSYIHRSFLRGHIYSDLCPIITSLFLSLILLPPSFI